MQEMADLLHACPSGLVAEHQESMIGFVLEAPTADPTIWEIAWMAVDARWQGQGIGGKLMETLCEALSQQGVRALEVSTVAESAGYAPYAATRAFYHHRGFVDLRVDPDIYWPGGDRLVLRRSLARPPDQQ